MYFTFNIYYDIIISELNLFEKYSKTKCIHLVLVFSLFSYDKADNAAFFYSINLIIEL
mgnify:CR=1 FL=1